MGASLKEICVAFADGPLADWLAQASASPEIEEAESKVKALEPIIGKKKTVAALRALAGSSRDARRLREKEASDALSEAVRKHGLVLEARAPLQRRKRKGSSDASAEGENRAPEGGPSNQPDASLPNDDVRGTQP